MSVDQLPKFIKEHYEVHEWRHAVAILRQDFKSEYNDICNVLTRFRLRKSWITVGGGRKSKVADWIDIELLQKGWKPKNFDTKITVDEKVMESPTHEVDCFKNRVALEIEWNNKDPFFDRDLNNFRLLFDLRAISVGVIITRCDELQEIFLIASVAGHHMEPRPHICLNFFPEYKVGEVPDVLFLFLVSGEIFMQKIVNITQPTAAQDFMSKVCGLYSTILADPPWRFENRTGKMAPEHQRLLRYPTMTIEEICEIPVSQVAAANSHLYLWVPNALLAEGLEVMKRWGFTYKTNIVWYKIRKDGGPDGRGVGFYFRNVTELVLFGVRGHMRTLQPGRTQVNIISSRKREHSRKPNQIYDVIENCSPGPYLELFARFRREEWDQWGNEDVEENSSNGVARRKGHIATQMRLFERPVQYGVNKALNKPSTKKRKLV